MNKEETAKQKTILNVGYCETTSEWLNRIITELADENKNFIDLRYRGIRNESKFCQNNWYK